MIALARTPTHPIEILLVEDNLGDIELTQEAFLKAKIPNRVHVARDGEEALHYLYRRGAFADAERHKPHAHQHQACQHPDLARTLLHYAYLANV